MMPTDPSSEPIELTPIPNPQPLIPKEPFFDYSDFFLFLGLTIPCLFIGLLIVRGIRLFEPIGTSVQLLLVQSVWYFLVFGCVAALFRIRYHRPFWESLGWRPLSLTAAACAILAGPLLALAVGLMGSALRTPEINLPFEQMLGAPGTVAFLGFLVVILGPVSEELAFRGFLMPLLVRNLGATGGIVLTGIIFGSIHGYEYRWSWQYMLLISAAGCVFGWAKHKTQSTVCSALMHSTFNLTQFVAFLAQQRSV
jgi:membrane protease YdiL (CAAX protease family)